MAVSAQMQQYQYQQEQATRRPEIDKLNQMQMIMNRYGKAQHPLSPGGKQYAVPTYAQNTGTVAPMGGGYAPPSAASAAPANRQFQDVDYQPPVSLGGLAQYHDESPDADRTYQAFSLPWFYNWYKNYRQ